MPFKSKAQLATCYSRNGKTKKGKKGWNCDKWLKETPSICCLPDKTGQPVKKRCPRKGEKIKGKVQTGPRGGRFFVIREKDSKGVICTVKVYLPRKSKKSRKK